MNKIENILRITLKRYKKGDMDAEMEQYKRFLLGVIQ